MMALQRFQELPHHRGWDGSFKGEKETPVYPCDTPAPNGDLSPREREVVRLIAEDLTSREIAERLNISTKTVNYHRQEIKHRIGVRGTAGIVRYAVRNGIIEP